MSTCTILNRYAFVLGGIASDRECQRWIAGAERAGFASAPVTTRNGPVHMPGLRNNARVMEDDPETAAELWLRVEPLLPAEWRHVDRRGTSLLPSGLNERLRFYRYDPGERFALHRDGPFVRDRDEHSLLTVLLFLNDDFRGGETALLEPRYACDVPPVRGDALCFSHHLLHEGTTVLEGTKYILRTDVMYRRQEPAPGAS